MKNILLGVLIGIGLVFAAGYVFLISGGMPVATKGPALPFERFVAHKAIHAAIGDAEDIPSPIAADEINLLAGAKVYVNQCAVCHGTPDGRASYIAKGLFPQPPQLFDPEDQITDDPAGEAFWKIKNGIRLTGMPGFVDSLTETEMWQLSQLLIHANALSPSVKQELMPKNP